MDTALMIFAAGIGGVFLGMGMLYGSIKITATVIGRWFDKPAKMQLPAARRAGYQSG